MRNIHFLYSQLAEIAAEIVEHRHVEPAIAAEIVAMSDRIAALSAIDQDAAGGRIRASLARNLSTLTPDCLDMVDDVTVTQPVPGRPVAEHY